ncbi:nuclear transport factor 2 family protein [Chitinophaga sp. MM2321]|uniref:nuclear transport factor 2 family protein n=1 Tax=Chitinophaga sp. MM2321 TaxID=3137178 RepID=UPI0032D5A764
MVPDGHHIREHFFHENRQLADQNLKRIEKIAKDNNVKTIYPTHNGPVATAELTKYIKEEPLLKLFSKQETDMLSDAVNGKAELQKKYLSDNFILQTADNKQYTKTVFIEQYIMLPNRKIASWSAEDFGIVNSNENTVILTYIETLKFVGKDPEKFAVTAAYSKEENGWKQVYKQSGNL